VHKGSRWVHAFGGASASVVDCPFTVKHYGWVHLYGIKAEHAEILRNEYKKSILKYNS
jgi:hypothetical protein